MSDTCITAYAIFSCVCLQLVCDLFQYLQNSMLMSSSPLSAYRHSVPSKVSLQLGTNRTNFVGVFFSFSLLINKLFYSK